MVTEPTQKRLWISLKYIYIYIYMNHKSFKKHKSNEPKLNPIDAHSCANLYRRWTTISLQVSHHTTAPYRWTRHPPLHVSHAYHQSPLRVLCLYRQATKRQSLFFFFFFFFVLFCYLFLVPVILKKKKNKKTILKKKNLK